MTRHEQNEVFQSWLESHGGLVFKIARSFAEDPSEQEDLGQEIWLAVWQSIPRFDSRCKESTYLYRIALNRAISWKRKIRSHRQKIDQLTSEHGHTGSMAHSSSRDPRLELIYAALRSLPEADRALMLLYLDHVPYKEIAETTGLTVSHVGVRLNRLRKQLTEELNKKKPHEY